MNKRHILAFWLAVVLLVGVGFKLSTIAQTPPATGASPISVYTPFVVTPLSATAAVGSAAVLTVPAPSAGISNYVCYLAIEGSVAAGTVAVITNATTASTNFNSFAAKFSNPGAVNTDTGVLILVNATPPGCPKSAAAASSTTFTSPTNTNAAFAWYATYFQAP